MRVVFLGPPGAGKGTQARGLAREWGVAHIATGDMLRDAVAAGSPLGREAKGHMDRGALVPDDVIIGLIAERFHGPDAAHGFILDGFPRTIPQAEALGRFLKDRGASLDRVIMFQVTEEELVRRLAGRRTCRACGEGYHASFAPPQRAGVCDKCGGELYQREDDREATVRNRLSVYAKQTAPLLEFYRNQSVLRTVEGEGPIDGIRAAVRKAAAA